MRPTSAGRVTKATASRRRTPPAGLASCLSLYTEGSAAQPYFAYNHASTIVPGETCSTGSSSVTGLAFYTAGSYPATYQGALFFTDWSRHCIWAMLPGANGAPDPSQSSHSIRE